MSPVKEDLIWTLETGSPEGSLNLNWGFAGSSVTGVELAGGFIGTDDARLRLADLPYNDDGRAFPTQFNYDPANGQPLRRRGADAPESSFPSFAADGFAPLLTSLRFRSGLEKARLAVPQGAIAIFSAGVATRIFCLTGSGELHFRASLTEWVFLERFASVDLPDYAFGVACFPQGFATIVSNKVIIGYVSGDVPRLTVKIKDRDGAVFCGAPALLDERHIGFPVRRGDALSIARFDHIGQAWKEDLPAGTLTDGGSFFCQPVQSASRTPDTFWIGASCYLFVGSEFGQQTATVRTFPDGLSAILGAPPLRDERNIIHALARNDQFYANVSLTVTPRVTRLDGPHLSAGQSRFFGRSYYPSFWDDAPIELPIEVGGGSLLLPLAFRAAPADAPGALVMKVEGVRDVGSLLHHKTDEWHSGHLYWHAGAQLQSLQVTLRFRSRFDIVIHCEREALVIGSAISGQFFRLTAS